MSWGERQSNGRIHPGDGRDNCRNYQSKKKVEITIRISASGKRKIIVDGYRSIKQSELVGASPAVFIFPEDIELTAGPASFHRQFLDLYISQYNRNYLDDLIAYRKIVLQRNMLLKDITASEAGLRQLQVWDKMLIEHGTRIINERDNLVKSISDNVQRYYNGFDRDSALSLVYRPKIAADESNIEKSMAKLLETYQSREIRAGLTLVGPHRDRLEINVNGKAVRHFGSRGQKRCAMIAMKLAAADYLSRIKAEPVTLVLDEVFAELDLNKSTALMGILSKYDQVFLATAGEFNHSDSKYTKFNVNKGKISRVENDFSS